MTARSPARSCGRASGRSVLMLPEVAMPIPMPPITPAKMNRTGSPADFTIGDEDITLLRGLQIRDYGDDSVFPVYSGR